MVQMVAVLTVNTEADNERYIKQITLYKTIFSAKQAFKYCDFWTGIELKKIDENYYEFEGIDKEGWKCNGSIFLQCVND